jgi:hypothetical protein
MSIDRRTVVLGLPTLAGLMLTGCQGDGDPSPAGASANGREGAQAVAGTGVSGSIYVSQVYGFTVGAFPTSATNIWPSTTIYQACFNGRELLVLLRDAASGTGGTAIRTIALKLVTNVASGWAPNSTLTIDMASSASNNYGSEGFIYHNPDYTSATPASAKYAYQMNAGQIIVSTGSTLDLVTIEFSANASLVKAVPMSSYSANSATGYIYIPSVNNRIVTLKARQEVEATV